jgi:hypothetical protein
MAALRSTSRLFFSKAAGLVRRALLSIGHTPGVIARVGARGGGEALLLEIVIALHSRVSIDIISVDAVAQGREEYRRGGQNNARGTEFHAFKPPSGNQLPRARRRTPDVV